MTASASHFQHASKTSSAKASNAVHSAQRQAEAYFSELLSYSLDRLRKEPEVLKAEREGVERNIQATAVSQHGAFIQAANCLTTIDQELQAVSDHLGLLLQGTPELAGACESFSADSAAVLEQYNQNKQLANGQAVILELLEVPQLMDTCVRNGIYDEALDLQSFVSRLGLLHPEVPVVRLLVRQVNEVGQTMLAQLLGRLKTNIQLPECLRIMGYLRRIAAFSEAELRLQFLSCRDEWISGIMDELDDSDSYEYVKHLTDVHRLHLFDAIMQYRALFFDAPQVPMAVQDSSIQAAVNSLKETCMLYSWVQHRITIFLQLLKQHLPNITEGSNLASVIEHCMYCGSSLSRVGLDFQGLLQPLFEACSLQLFAMHLSTAIDTFNSRLETHKWVPMPSPGANRGKPDKAAAGALKEGEETDEAVTAGSASVAVDDEAGPPYVVMEHFPLAVFTNAVLAALNELRHCALLSVGKTMAGLLQQTLEHAAASLTHYRHTHALGKTELPLFKAACRAMLEVVLPYLTTAFSRVFPSTVTKLDNASTSSILRDLLADL